MSVLRAAADLGLRIPDDLSLVGFDNIPMSNYLVPRLTTVTKDAAVLGKKAFELLLARIQNLISRNYFTVRTRSSPSTGPTVQTRVREDRKEKCGASQDELARLGLVIVEIDRRNPTD